MVRLVGIPAILPTKPQPRHAIWRAAPGGGP